MKISSMSIGDKIRQARQEKHIKQEELANHLEIGQGTLSKIENDVLPVSATDLLRIASYTNTPIDKLLPDDAQINIQNSNNAVLINQDQYIDILNKRLVDLEEWVKDLRDRNNELFENVKFKNHKIEILERIIEKLQAQ